MFRFIWDNTALLLAAVHYFCGEYDRAIFWILWHGVILRREDELWRE